MHYYSILFSWLIYFFLHSFFAGNWAKNVVETRFPGFFPYYRLTYNALALVLLVPPLYFTYTFPGEMLWQWEGIWGTVSTITGVLAIVGFLSSFRVYSGLDFLGFNAFSNTSEPSRAFCISSFHRYVRHPWYFFALILIWTRDMNTPFLLTSVLISLYFVVGSRLEEKKLIEEFGEPYRLYMGKVAGLIPLPWKLLSKEDAQQLSTVS